MPTLSFILQAATPASNAEALDKVLALDNPSRVLISVAYVRESGVARHHEALRKVAAHTRALVGIRNEITSIQAVERLLEAGIDVFAVDTAKRNRIFHPKLYLSRNAEEAFALLGSANLTSGGMARNIEASTLITLSMNDAADRKFVDSVFDAFDAFAAMRPKHVFRVKNISDARRLLEQGRLADERVVRIVPVIGDGAASKVRDDLAPMPLHKPKMMSKLAAPLPASTPSSSIQSLPNGFVCVWQSRPLKNSNLNIPTGGGKTNRTGFIGFGKGLYAQINQLTYFRRRVFKGLEWHHDDLSKPHLELAQAEFRVVIKQVDYGIFTLDIRHNSNQESATAKENNHVTNLRWGSLWGLVSNPDLLGRTLSIFRKEGSPPTFLLDID